MPVLFNTESGLAENLPDDAAQSALQSGTHEVPIVDPETGNIGSATHEDAAALVQRGYRQPNPQELQKLLTRAQYSTPGQHAIGLAEQFAKGVGGPLASMGEIAAGVPAEDIREREEALGAGEKMVAEGSGLFASEFVPGGFGQAKILGKLGEGAAHLLGIGDAASTVAKVGSAAAKAAIENTVFQAGDEATKRILGDPNQTAGNAMMNIGLAGLIGGGIGSVFGAAPIAWDATLGPKAENFLRAITSRANGESLPLSEDLESVISGMEKSGKTIPPEIRAGLSYNPIASDYFNELRESGTTTGDALRQTIDQFKLDVGDQLKGVFQEQGPVTAFEAGETAKKELLKTAEELNDQVSANYDKVNPDRELIKSLDKDRQKSWNTLIKTGQEEFGEDSPHYQLFKEYGNRFLARDTIGQLDKLRTELLGEIRSASSFANPNFEKARALGMIRDFIGDFQDSQIGRAGKELYMLEGRSAEEASAMAKQLVTDTQTARESYKEFLKTISEAAGAGKLGKVNSYGQFTEALEKIPSAKLADKLFDQKNIEGLRVLSEKYPDLWNSLVQARKTNMIESATSKGDLMHNQLLNSVNKLPREVRDMMFSKEEQGTINAAGRILRETSKRPNPSGTAMSLDKVMQNIPAGIGAMAGMLMGHNPVVGFMLGHAGKFLGRDAPDAIKASLLKFLGSPEVLEGSAWKTMADYFVAAEKGHEKIATGAKELLKTGQLLLPEKYRQDAKSREKLNKRLLALQENPQEMLDIGGKLGHYAPDHAQALGAMTAQTVNYLNSLRPQSVQNSPLDEPYEDEQQKRRFDSALDIAQNPMNVFRHMGEGRLLPTHIVDLSSMYPQVYNGMKQALTEQLVEHLSDGGSIPYDMRVTLSNFLGDPLDSSLTQQGIMAAQMAQGRISQQVQAARQAPMKGKSAKALEHVSEDYRTASQAREVQRQSSKA